MHADELRSIITISVRIASSCLIDGVVVVVPVQEDVEAEREGEDEQGIPEREEGRLFLHRDGE